MAKDLDINKMKKEAEAYAKAITASEKSLLQMETTIGKIGGELFSLSINDFFKEIERSPEIMKKLQDEVKAVKKELAGAEKKMNDAFSKNAIKYGTIDDLITKVSTLEAKFPDASKLMIDELTAVKASGGAITELNFSKIFKGAPQEAAELANEILRNHGGATKLNNTIEKVVKNTAKFQALNKELSQTHIKTLALDKAFGKFIEKNFSIEKIIGTMTDFDKVITDAQRNFGIEMVANASKVTGLVIEGARFGQTAESMSKFMGQLGDTLNTTNFNLLEKAAEDTMAIAAATGLANEDVAKLTGQFMLLGQSSENVASFVEETANQSRRFGLNTKKVLEDINKNFSKFKNLGFSGGEDSLKKMVITAQRLRMNIDEIFNVAEKARTIEGAMEMAAELQLAGGSFAQIDPMQLLSAARKGPAELTKILGDMGGDVGRWVTDMKGNKKYEFDPIDADRLAMVAKATGMSVESLQNQIVKGAEKVKKEGQGLFSGVVGGMTEDEKAMIDQFTTLGADGKTIKFEGAFDGENLDSFKKLTQADIKARLEGYTKDKDTNEEAAKINMAFVNSLTNLKNSFMNVFTILEPALRALTGALNWINSLPQWGKYIIVGLGAFLMAFKSIVFRDMIGNFLGKAGGIFGKIGGMLSGAPAAPAATATASTKPGTGGMFGSMSPAKIRALGAAASEAAPGILALGAAILMIGGGIAIASLGLAKLVGAFALLTGTQMVGALIAISVVMGGFVGMLYLMIPAIAGLALAGTAGAIGLLALGAAFLMIGAGIGLAAWGMSLFVDSLAKIKPEALSGMGGGLFAFAAGLGAITVAMWAFANPFSLIAFTAMVAALSSLAFVMSSLGPNLEKGGTGMSAMAKGVTELSTALKALDVTNLDKVKNFAETSALSKAVNALVSTVGGASNNAPVQKFQIEVIVKNENGREIQRRILKDSDILSV